MNVTAVCLSREHFHSANVPGLAFSHCATRIVGPLTTAWKFSTITLPTCTSQAANITQRNTRSVLEPDYRRHTQLASYTAEGAGGDSESFRVVSCECNTQCCQW